MTRSLPMWAVVLAACGEPSSTVDLRGDAGVVHRRGYVEAHGAALAATDYDFAPCLACHDGRTEGVVAAPDCQDCHEDGADACAVCHDGAEDPGHRQHAAFGCETCHPVPAVMTAVAHLEDRGGADVRFDGVARARGHSPRYADGRCADTACHGGPGARVPVPTWGEPATGACDACHGDPPPEHPVGRCDGCHGEVVDDVPRIVDSARHVDGEVQAVDWRALGCDGCHGSAGSPLPRDPSHVVHAEPEASAPVACGTCHRVPAAVDAPGHVDDGGPAEVMLSDRAGPGAAWAPAGCTASACHGADRPVWGAPSAGMCGTCHGNPPAAPHPSEPACGRCHLDDGVPSRHVDGALDLDRLGAGDCGLCHDEGGVVATLGGSHDAHARFDCAECHPTPATPRAEGHLDGVATVRLGEGRYRAGTCAGTTCHGAGRPVWGRAGTLDGCGACHGDPPAGHAPGDCADCHPDPDSAAHVNGTLDLDLPTDCGACHGAPPPSGAHISHADYDCETCHAVPARVDAPGHLDPAPAEVGLVTGDYVGGACAEKRCHGLAGASVPRPGWEDGPQAAACGACHALPPDDGAPHHTAPRFELPCGTCHPGGDAPDARHVDGEVRLR